MKYSSKKDTSFWKLVRSFLHEYMPVIRNLSKSTVSTYKDSLQMLLDFLKEEKNIKDGQVTFEVFKRDSFTCQYCGKSAPDAVLEVDHIIPVSKGGDNDISNLITSCFECNRGKSNKKLTDNQSLKLQKKELDRLLKLAKSQKSEEHKQLSKKGKLFCDSVIKSIDIQGYEPMSFNEVDEDEYLKET